MSVFIVIFLQVCPFFHELLMVWVPLWLFALASAFALGVWRKVSFIYLFFVRLCVVVRIMRDFAIIVFCF